MFRFLLFSCFLFISFYSNAQIYTGFRQMMEFDSTRTFDTISTSKMHVRPVKIDLFYPSTSVRGNALTYGDFLDMYSLRMVYNIMDHLGSKDKFFVKIDGATHEHFSSIITVGNAIKPNGKEKEIAKTQRIWKLYESVL